MSVELHGTHVEIFKFKETGMLPLFDEVINFILDESLNKGVRWEPVDMYTTSTDYRVRLERII